MRLLPGAQSAVPEGIKNLMKTLKIELPYVIEKTGVLKIRYYAHLIGLNFCGKPAPTKPQAVKSLMKVVREMEKFWLDNYQKRDEAGVSLPGK